MPFEACICVKHRPITWCCKRLKSHDWSFCIKFTALIISLFNTSYKKFLRLKGVCAVDFTDDLKLYLALLRAGIDPNSDESMSHVHAPLI